MEGLNKKVEKGKTLEQEKLEKIEEAKQTIERINKIAGRGRDARGYSKLKQIINIMNSIPSEHKYTFGVNEKGGSYGQDSFYLEAGPVQYKLGTSGVEMISKLVEEEVLLPEEWTQGYFTKGEDGEEESVNAEKKEFNLKQFIEIPTQEKTTLDYRFNDAFYKVLISKRHDLELNKEVQTKKETKDDEVKSFWEGFKKTRLSFGGYNSASSHVEKTVRLHSVLKSMENINNDPENEGVFVATVENFIGFFRDKFLPKDVEVVYCQLLDKYK